MGSRPSPPIRLMAGLTILKHTFDLSDKQLVDQRCQNPYWQLFCGESHFRWKLPCDPSEMTRFRKRIGADGCERILKASLDVQREKVDITADVVIDSTVQEKNVIYPTFAKLDAKVIQRCRAIAAAEGIAPRQSSVRVLGPLQIAARSTATRSRPSVARRAAPSGASARLHGVLLRELSRKLSPESRDRLAAVFRAMHIAVRQTAEPGSQRIHSLHEPDVICLPRARPTTRRNRRQGRHRRRSEDRRHRRCAAPGWSAARSRVRCADPGADLPSDGTTPRVIADLGYRGAAWEGETRILTPATMKGTACSTRKRLRRALRRRQVVEATIGRLKALHRMGRNFLKGILGDRLNVLLAAAGNNFRRWLRSLWLLLQWLGLFLFSQPGRRQHQGQAAVAPLPADLWRRNGSFRVNASATKKRSMMAGAPTIR